MDIAIVALTDQGVKQGRKLLSLLDSATLYASSSTSASSDEDLITFDTLRSFAEEQFHQYDAFLCIMAAGIVVRVFAPLLEGKDRDPAVLVMDETASFVIPLISGHLGGANHLARRIGDETKSTPVITTATDINNVPAIDERERTEGMTLHPLCHIKTVNLALLDGERIHVYSDEPLDWSPSHFRIHQLDSAGPISLDQFTFSSSCGVIVSNRISSGETELPILFLRPRNLYAGVGYRKNREADALISEIESTLERCYKHQSSLAALCTIDLKENDRAILETADYFDVPIRFFSGTELETFEDRCNTSEFVKETTGAGSVCEAAALAASNHQPTMIQEKTTSNGITTALVEDTFTSRDSAPETSS